MENPRTAPAVTWIGYDLARSAFRVLFANRVPGAWALGTYSNVIPRQERTLIPKYSGTAMKLRSLLQTGIALSCLGLCNARLLTIPSTLFTESSGEYSLSQLKRIVVDSQYADAVDEKGQTLIPPTLHQFAETFQEDLNSALRLDLKLKTAKKAPKNSIFITIGEDSGFKDAAGRDTSEGYKLEVNDNGIVITGASPLGAWWGTRSLLQAAVLGDSSVAQGSGVDAPGWGTRGAFVCQRPVSYCYLY